METELLDSYRSTVEEALRSFPLLKQTGEATDATPELPEGALPPQPLRNAMRYSLLLPGKRLRPVLLLAAYHLLQEDWTKALPFACALEMIHTYSLIHDDLPAMDDDEFRRGQLTNHKVFGEAVAILAGDGLLNLAFETMLSAPVCLEKPTESLRAVREIAERAGVRGMIAGQTLDVTMEGAAPSKEIVRYIHLHKTADLLTAPLTAGLMLAGADEEQLEAARVYGQNLGIAFQIQDDLLDLEGDASLLGKATGMDAERGKMTWPAVCGIAQSRVDAEEAITKAVDALSVFGEKADALRLLAKSTLKRNH